MSSRESKNKLKAFILDVDGVLTNGQFLYTTKGKVMKVFGPDDNDALSLLKPYLTIRFVTGDKKGFEISRKRIVEDMEYDLDLVSTIRRLDWIQKNFNSNEVIYMGDGIFDHYVWPTESCHLEGAENIQVPVDGHHKILSYPGAREIVIEKIALITALLEKQAVVDAL